jgi:uncharacterized membrane protein (DUF485 family)
MCFFFSFIPGTIWLVIGYFVLFSSTRADGTVQTFGRGLAIWAFVISGCFVLAGAYVTLTGLCSLEAFMECTS